MSFHVQARLTPGSPVVLAGTAFAIASTLLLFVSVRGVGKYALLGWAAAIGTACLLRWPKAALYIMLLIGPLYDWTRAFIFGEAPLIGAWQDVLVIFLVFAAIVNLAGGRAPRLCFTWLDCAVVLYIGAYLLSVLVAPDVRVWFYGFRWSTLYAFMYLALKTYRFTDREIERVVRLVAITLVVSAGVGFTLLNVLGDKGYYMAMRAMGLGVMGREETYRWPATFANSLVASGAFGLLLIISASYLLTRRFSLSAVAGALVALYAIGLTLSRSGWVVGVGGVIAIIWAAGQRSRVKLSTIAAIALTLAVGSLVALAARPELRAMASLSYEGDASRMASFQTVLVQSVAKYPLGTGAGTAGAVADTAVGFAGLGSTDSVVGDSVSLAVLRDTGWPGFCAFVVIFVGFIHAARRAIRMSTGRSQVVAFVALGFLAGSFLNLTNLVDVFPLKLYVWLFGAFMVAIVEGRVDCAVKVQ